MNLKLTTGVRDQKAAGSNPATSTRDKAHSCKDCGLFCMFISGRFPLCFPLLVAHTVDELFHA